MAVESKAAAAGVLCAECALVSGCASGRLLSKCMRCSSKQQEGEGVVHSKKITVLANDHLRALLATSQLSLLTHTYTATRANHLLQLSLPNIFG